jgi:hypothetical protein
MKKQLPILVATACLLFAACQNKPASTLPFAPAIPPAVVTESYPKGSFGYDLDFLKQHDQVVVLTSAPGSAGSAGIAGIAQVIVSPKYQAKVFTSTADGDAGQSFGWINYKAFTGAPDTHMNAYGGENRIWLGPEGGKFSLFFPKGMPMVFQNWKTPAPFDTESWTVTAQDGQSVSLHKDMQLMNYKGIPLSLSIARKITILDGGTIDTLLHLSAQTHSHSTTGTAAKSADTATKIVGYRTENTMTNTGRQAWTAITGMPCIWMLDMFRPSSSVVIIIPHKQRSGRLATTDYFGKIPGDRLSYKKGVLLFKADGRSRGKLGIYPPQAMSMAASYDAQNKVLTIVLFDVDPDGKYLNQEWNTVKPSFSGDAVNAYNDGPLADGSQMGPFYEIESVSPAAFLPVNQSLTHHHTVFHFTGGESGLDKISRQVLGIGLQEIKSAF